MDSVYPVSSQRVIETRIQSANTVINHYITQVRDEKKIIAAFSKEIAELKEQLAEIKVQKDTVQIIQIQDTLINLLTHENYSLRNVVNMQDSIIVAQRYIINSKDTLIAIAQHDSKKYKKQRNRAVAGNVVQGVIIGGLLLFK